MTDEREILYWNVSTDYSITNEKGEKLTAEKAREHWESCNLKDCNAAFRRLAQYDFDIEAAKASYEEL